MLAKISLCDQQKEKFVATVEKLRANFLSFFFVKHLLRWTTWSSPTAPFALIIFRLGAAALVVAAGRSWGTGASTGMSLR